MAPEDGDGLLDGYRILMLFKNIGDQVDCAGENPMQNKSCGRGKSAASSSFLRMGAGQSFHFMDHHGPHTLETRSAGAAQEDEDGQAMLYPEREQRTSSIGAACSGSLPIVQPFEFPETTLPAIPQATRQPYIPQAL
ncbi:hypothetical protein [Rhizobium lusitanum]|uniref:Uncharacterized protein n=1 Tax=Rhizobium lusitanum TaxID=293958 RepID=A0A7X0IRZ1_9HYPH|nr:hypothetical protein [Rhizobium lusitanum]MBB6485744.1 hypothetical protein [Rhizobium lusitanum]